jgi:plasmid maintenance system antidote protein VapI
MRKGRALLLRHIEESGLTHKAFAEACGISAPMLSHILAGDRNVTLHVAFWIQRASHGAVPAEIWVDQRR